MSEALTPQQLQKAPGTQPGDPKLDLDQIQGDVLIGLQKFFERFVFFAIQDAPAFKAALRQDLAKRITTTREVHQREFDLNALKIQGKRDRLPLIGLNLGFTAEGIGLLVPGADLGDPSFANGAKKQAAALNDPVDGQGNPTTWLAAFLNATIHGVFLVTGGTASAVQEEFDRITGLLGHAISVVYDETGQSRPGLERGHEHFGWLDGVSQPGIKGLSDPFPGQQLLDPGFFVFGYPGPTAAPPLPWMRNGAFMVFRRLQQLVPEFHQFLVTEANDQGMDSVLLGGRLVGRWQSGAPMELTPLQDDSTLGPDPQRNNNFDFADDQGERRCPFGAHIRKTNPRKDIPEQFLDPHRIIRAGIPFGPELSTAEQQGDATEQERGLMFVCYQTSIPEQFEFVQNKWANNPGFVPGKHHPDGTVVSVGFDPIIGQNAGGAPRTTDEPVPNYPTGNVRSTLHEPQNFIVPTAAAYCFVPSIAALENELSA